MKGYDFDKTIFKGNSYRHFYFYCLLRFPYLILYLPIQAFFMLLCILHIVSVDFGVQMFCKFTLFLPHRERVISRFWDKHIKRIAPWYFEQHDKEDFVISGSPRFLVEEGCRRIGISTVIATDVDIKYGNILGEHCLGETKLTEYKKVFGDAVLDEFYSDSLSDLPMLCYATRGYLVKHNERTLYTENGKVIDPLDSKI
ncbi:MAG: haloacid dehalogenase-like hydrolase [Clostridia bacterium]